MRHALVAFTLIGVTLLTISEAKEGNVFAMIVFGLLVATIFAFLLSGKNLNRSQ